MQAMSSTPSMLECIDDIKKDEFGLWNYSGSHPVCYRVQNKHGYMAIEKCAKGADGSNVFLSASVALYSSI